jgi:protein-tyrosine phosphatase
MHKIFPVWRQGLVALLFLGALFFASYDAANKWASAMHQVPSIVFTWEAYIPFLPWTILPYWSIDLFYGLSLLVAANTFILKRQFLRLLTAQAICIGCFFAWPLKFSFVRPQLDGWEGFLFNALTSFDLPYNQAPSLHIVLLLILWEFFSRRVTGLSKLIVHAWSALIGVSVLTTYQHHFIDVPTGMLVGFICMWAWPLEGHTPWQSWRMAGSPSKLSLVYAGSALLLGMGAVWFGIDWHPVAWFLLWPALAFALVALAYVGFGIFAFQKDESGRVSPAAWWLFAPYRLVAWLNSRCWTYRIPTSSHVTDGVYLGRAPLPWDADFRQFSKVLDLTAELDISHQGLVSMPMLDLIPPSPLLLIKAADQIEAWVLSQKVPALVCCALGFSRSTAVLLVWLCRSGRAANFDEALTLLKQVRPKIVVTSKLQTAIHLAICQDGARA